MWLAALKRYLRRRRIIYIFLFALCITYLLMHLVGNRISHATDNDNFAVRRARPIIWRTLQEHVLQEPHNQTNNPAQRCRNTVQGKMLIVDDRGFLCERQQLLANGCCNVELDGIKYYTCETCQATTYCCAIYEHCVSCCLHPAKRQLLEEALAKISGRQAMVYARVDDHFELCLVKCRTNSHSVQHENRYRDPMAKYCYGETHESQLEVSGSAGH